MGSGNKEGGREVRTRENDSLEGWAFNVELDEEVERVFAFSDLTISSASFEAFSLFTITDKLRDVEEKARYWCDKTAFVEGEGQGREGVGDGRVGLINLRMVFLIIQCFDFRIYRDFPPRVEDITEQRPQSETAVERIIMARPLFSLWVPSNRVSFRFNFLVSKVPN